MGHIPIRVLSDPPCNATLEDEVLRVDPGLPPAQGTAHFIGDVGHAEVPSMCLLLAQMLIHEGTVRCTGEQVDCGTSSCQLCSRVPRVRALGPAPRITGVPAEKNAHSLSTPRAH
jgi:hypothetical protein